MLNEISERHVLGLVTKKNGLWVLWEEGIVCLSWFVSVGPGCMSTCKGKGQNTKQKKGPIIEGSTANHTKVRW